MNVVIAFDIDGVLLSQKSSWRAMHSYFGVDNSDNVKKFWNGEISYDEFVDLDIKLLLRKNPCANIKDFIKIREALTPNPHHEELGKFLSYMDGRKIAISGGIDILVERVKDFFPLEEIHANHLVFSNGKLVGGIASVNPEMKGAILKRYEGKKISVGDSRFDQSMFEVSDVSILFNSEDDVNVDYVIKGNDLLELTKLLRDIYYG